MDLFHGKFLHLYVPITCLSVRRSRNPFLHISLVSFFYPTPQPNTPPWENRNDFFMLGHFRHPPNYDSILWMKSLWPKVRTKMPHAKLFIYGAHPMKEVMELTDASNGFFVKGPIKEEVLYKTISKYRVNVAPLRFGAGIKGKISDSWWTGTPVVTTQIGSEGMCSHGQKFDEYHVCDDWGGDVCGDEEALICSMVRLHEDREYWERSSKIGKQLMCELFDREKNSKSLMDDLSKLLARKQHGEENLFQRLLCDSSDKRFEYLNKWIDGKQHLREQPTIGKETVQPFHE
eukprot:TRINITY_DN7964_c0_g1_i6.p1 TRINITY_DN7964_c0_g1~~TRINITY_DN7964_c0_g1_i6.p1  ORF type:complete len:289 (+),score=51.12 TRINITY_DN7964_c0_g1_i6:611-1477(+)